MSNRTRARAVRVDPARAQHAAEPGPIDRANAKRSESAVAMGPGFDASHRPGERAHAQPESALVGQINQFARIT